MQTKKTRTTAATADARRAVPAALAAACLLAALLTISCTAPHTPRPRGYLRDLLPPPAYAADRLPGLPVCAQTNSSSTLSTPSPGRAVISYPWLNAAVYISYTPICGPSDTLLRQTLSAPAAHAPKALAIYSRRYENPATGIYADLFDIEGDTAANAMFIATDSARHLLCGTLYFDRRPRYDSLRPSVLYIRADIAHLLETLTWEN